MQNKSTMQGANWLMDTVSYPAVTRQTLSQRMDILNSVIGET